jgi:hypothetical protein
MALLESALRRESVSREPEANRPAYVPIASGLSMSGCARDDPGQSGMPSWPEDCRRAERDPDWRVEGNALFSRGGS